MRVDSDTDNSIVVENNRHKKLACLKDTPLKIDNSNISTRKTLHNDSIMDQSDETSEGSDDSGPESDEPKRSSTRYNYTFSCLKLAHEMSLPIRCTYSFYLYILRTPKDCSSKGE